jgi:hypothetical protein
MSKVVVNSEMLEIPLGTIPASGKTVNFPNNQNVFNGKVTSIEVQSGLSFAPSGATACNDFSSLYFNILEKGGRQRLTRFPAQRLNPSTYIGQEILFDNISIDPQKCIVIIAPNSGLSDNQSLIVEIYYNND